MNSSWRRFAVMAGVLVALAGPARAQAQPNPQILHIFELLHRWGATPPRMAVRGLTDFADQNRRAREGDRASVRAALQANYAVRPSAYRDVLLARKRFTPAGTAEERGDVLRFTLAAGVGCLMDVFQIPRDPLLVRLRGRAFGWGMHVGRFEQSLNQKDWNAADTEFTYVARAVVDVLDEELAKGAPSPAASALASPADAPSAAPTDAASAAPPGDAVGPATGYRPVGTLGAVGGLGLLVFGLLRFLKSRGGADLSGPLGLLARGQPAAALKALQGLLPRAGARTPEVRAHMIRCMVRMGQIELAMQALAELDREKTPLRALYLLARDFEERAQTKVAVELYARVYLADANLEDARERYDRLRAVSGLSAAILSPSDLAARLPARYSKAELIGHGGMGVVMKAYDEVSGREVALKVIAPAVASDTSFVSRFKREIRALTSLDHPAIVRVLDSQVTPFPYYAMELLSGQTLSRVIKAGPVPEKRACALGLQAAQGLASAHERGVIHRDVKPDNIMVEAGDRVKLVDFGLAHLAGATSLTLTGITAGSAPYMSPEALRGEPTGPATDVYALGLVLHQMLAGRPAFGNAQPTVRLVQEPPLLTGVTPALGALVARCTAHGPEARPGMMQLALELAKFV